METSIFAPLNGATFNPQFENPADKDFVSVHLDDYFGIPWTEFQNGTTLPSAWAQMAAAVRNDAAASGVYFVLAEGAGEKTTMKVAIQR